MTSMRKPSLRSHRTSMNSNKIDRRTLLFGSLPVMDAGAQTPALETLTQWLNAPLKTRRLALNACLDRIRAAEPSIHAWVQVSAQKATGQGKLSGIPFGVKDIIETRDLPTEYGSPIYKGRIGAADAAIVRQMRRRGAILLGKTQ